MYNAEELHYTFLDLTRSLQILRNRCFLDLYTLQQMLETRLDTHERVNTAFNYDSEQLLQIRDRQWHGRNTVNGLVCVDYQKFVRQARRPDVIGFTRVAKLKSHDGCCWYFFAENWPHRSRYLAQSTLCELQMRLVFTAYHADSGLVSSFTLSETLTTSFYLRYYTSSMGKFKEYAYLKQYNVLGRAYSFEASR